MRVQLRVVAGSLRGRKFVCDFHADIRPTPQMVRAALFSMLGDAVPGRPFFDVFGGSGAVGLEAISRGASRVVFVERDFRLADGIDRHLKAFGVADKAKVLRADAYRWAERWEAPSEPVNVFVSPPFPDFERRPDALMELMASLRDKVAAGSVLVLQSEEKFDPAQLPAAAEWELRRYGRNWLLLLVKEPAATPPADPP